MKKGSLVYVEGDSHDLGIKDYNCRVSTFAKILTEPRKYAKKIFVCLYDIDGDKSVWTFVKRNKIKELFKK